MTFVSLLERSVYGQQKSLHFLSINKDDGMTGKMRYFIPMQDEVISIPLINHLKLKVVLPSCPRESAFLWYVVYIEGVCASFYEIVYKVQGVMFLMLDIIPSQNGPSKWYVPYFTSQLHT